MGAGVGAIIGFLGAMRGASESGLPLAHAELFPDTALAAMLGCLAGVIFWRLRRLRERGVFYYCLSWALSVCAAMALVLLPETVKTREWLLYITFVGGGFFAGLGLGGYTLLILRNRQ